MKIYKNGKYIYINDDKENNDRDNNIDKNNDINSDKDKKGKISIDIYYPRVNDKSVYEQYKSREPVMKIINMSSTKLTILSKVFLNTGDFINFSLALRDYPSFWCLCEVKNIKFQDEYCETECQFYSLTMEQINSIKQYINSI
ncbi:PilZ domain-containing protein [Clostridium sp. MSJ-11]|uniref:PilZ domain-containing protein n=1 Tax=Clostridium mobile TaxID=2841512 RepID=A0ABS6EJK0_9CLOT|nr:PilZ domain-containing protein [Clostridium mobile]MBU5484856.1 PilZ domain-containing protein [Clostridium mobile]